jgi:hypothetical protein
MDCGPVERGEEGLGVLYIGPGMTLGQQVFHHLKLLILLVNVVHSKPDACE